MVASAGTALTEEQARILSRHAPQVVLIFDGDAAGSSAALRGVEVLLGAGLDARVVSLPEEHDPDTFVREVGPEALRRAIDQAGSALDFYLEQVGQQWDLSSMVGRARAIEAVKPLLVRCQDAVRRDLMLREVAQRLGVDERAIRQELQQALRRQGPAERPREEAAAPGPEDPPLWEKEFLGLLLRHPRFISPTAQQFSPEMFGDPRSQAIARLLFERSGDESLDLSLLMSRVEDEAVVQFISTCAMVDFDEAQVEQQWRDYVHRIQRDTLTRQIDQTRQALQAAVAARDEPESARLNAALVQLIKERQSLEAASDP